MLPDKVDAAPLVEKLVDKTRAGKIAWEPTADESTFVAAVGGTSFRVRMQDIAEDWQNTVELVPVLDLFDDNGKQVWSVRSDQIKTNQLWTLHELAQRIGNRVDERVDNLLSALDEL